MGASGEDTKLRQGEKEREKEKRGKQGDGMQAKGGAEERREHGRGAYVCTWASGVGRRVCSVFRALLVRCGAMGETSTWTVAGSCVWVARACMCKRVCVMVGRREEREG